MQTETLKDKIAALMTACREDDHVLCYKDLATLAAAAEEQQLSMPPPNHWRVNGECDPHAGHYEYDEKGGSLADYSADELANAVFMHYDQIPPLASVIARTAKMPIVYVTAAKDRLRWQSRRIDRLETLVAQLIAEKFRACEDGVVVNDELAAFEARASRECGELKHWPTDAAPGYANLRISDYRTGWLWCIEELGKPGLTRDEIREILISHGFEVKPGQEDLRPYVFAAAKAIREA